MSELQITPCKHCGYREYGHGGTLASWHQTNWISKEPLIPICCTRCNKTMQIYEQSGHRRFWKCWECNAIDADSKYYDSGSKHMYEDKFQRQFLWPEKYRVFPMDPWHP